ncbi:hypothetical protein EWH12_09900 [Sphingobium cupriresistens]|uniref:Uncharacterized protein n=1 Tax=Sphingobium cupriresistens TaxID=1132417 RepID=A0A8G2DVQ9_9SPHN|nr:hypothetical protein EWH12_09900 [Sphingobium cupriresistens]
MALTNAQRQARLRDRNQKRLSESVTPEDVDRAVKLIYEAFCVEEGEASSLPSWDDWLADLERRSVAKAGERWREMAPESADPDDYPDHIALEDRQFLAKVGAVMRAARWPAKHR